MLPPPTEFSPEAQNLPKSHHAGHFEHVAHMNVFDSESPIFRIPAKISFVKLSTKEADPSGLRDKKAIASDLTRESDFCSKLIEQVKLDMRLNDREDKSGPENSTTSCSSAKEKRKSREKREENANKIQGQKDDNDDAEWAKAKGKVEEFLDFPGVFAAIAFRDETKAKQPSQSSARNDGPVSQYQPNTIPNTRHNAIFLRDYEKAAEAILWNPSYQKGDQPQVMDSQRSTTKSQGHGTKMVKKHKSLVDSVVPESNTVTER
ncbi:uncharacterized protein LOC121003851 [Bufo bufo]|uniref:uncharacterized protein LOC121003851 n=1 Tax=Bufo bufo TaxID=8384 RepID=UPI001ABDDCE0|nr:uncharacterized protein LOC121003851 [Bufo bufo]XP_040291723.1 uncharacterized protein LOC121003851 [Bufo bufo]